MEKVIEIRTIKQVTEEVDIPFKAIRSPQDVVDNFQYVIGDEAREIFLVMCLSTKNTVNAIFKAHIGSLNASIVDPKTVFQSALLSNSASIVVGHGHPSSDPHPSNEDVDVTKRLVEGGKVLGVQVLDHIIIGTNSNNFISLKSEGYM